MSKPANTPTPPRPRKGTWIRAVVALADGSSVELRIPDCVSGSVATYAPGPAEVASVVLTTEAGQVRRGRLTQIFGRGG